MLEVVTTGVGTRQHSRVALATFASAAPTVGKPTSHAQGRRVDLLCEMRPLRGQSFMVFALPFAESMSSLSHRQWHRRPSDRRYLPNSAAPV